MTQFPDEQNEKGSFERQPDEFRNWVKAPEAGRYHLYVCKACPWAHRAWLTRNLMGLGDAVSVNFVDPIRDDETGWAFRAGDGHGLDDVENFKYLSEAYKKTDPNFKGRITVPVLWDKKEQRIVNNSEDDIIEMWVKVFKPLAKHPVDLFPEDIKDEQAALSQRIYEDVNNGVYEAGFASSQSAYEKAYTELFDTLESLEARLSNGHEYLFGSRIVETVYLLNPNPRPVPHQVAFPSRLISLIGSDSGICPWSKETRTDPTYHGTNDRIYLRQETIGPENDLPTGGSYQSSHSDPDRSLPTTNSFTVL